MCQSTCISSAYPKFVFLCSSFFSSDQGVYFLRFLLNTPDVFITHRLLWQPMIIFNNFFIDYLWLRSARKNLFYLFIFIFFRFWRIVCRNNFQLKILFGPLFFFNNNRFLSSFNEIEDKIFKKSSRGEIIWKHHTSLCFHFVRQILCCASDLWYWIFDVNCCATGGLHILNKNYIFSCNKKKG